ncbi:phage holin [Winslowiella sp. 2C04]|uniref:phage holin n=1 Tax=Winslowiella sp. 2C04 TaxID=3416179 RepID=UPI003CF56961
MIYSVPPFQLQGRRSFIFLTRHSTTAEPGVIMSIDMSKLASGAAYGASAGTVANGLLNRLSPDEWSAVGVLAGIIVALLTFAINFYFKRKVSLAKIKALEERGYIHTEKFGED